jgi:hypothetical protein
MSGDHAVGAPLGAFGVLAGLNDSARQRYLDYCPEMKMMFPSLHNPACFGAEPDPIGCFRYLCEHGGLKCNKHGHTELAAKNKGDHIKITLDMLHES